MNKIILFFKLTPLLFSVISFGFGQSPPTLYSPDNGFEIIEGLSNVNFQWSSVDDAAYYEIWIDNNSGFGSPEIGYNNGVSENWLDDGIGSGNWSYFSFSETIQNQLPQNVYFWKVRALNSYSSTDPMTGWSEVRSFILLDDCDSCGTCDCLRVCDGTDFTCADACGVLNGDNSSCADCAGDPCDQAGCQTGAACDGVPCAVEDNCETCDSNGSNDCVQDCLGEWGGEYMDNDGDGYCNCEWWGAECDCNDNDPDAHQFGAEQQCIEYEIWGCCDPEACNYNPEANSGCWWDDDCHVLDNCGTCDSDPSNDCVQDCVGNWGGDAVDDECGVCGGDGSSCGDNNYVLDGVWIGTELTNTMTGEITMTFLDSVCIYTSEMEYVSGYYYVENFDLGINHIEIHIEEYLIDENSTEYVGLSSLCIYEIIEGLPDALTIACNEPGLEEWPFTFNPEEEGNTARIYWLQRSNSEYVYGCTNPGACNYNLDAQINDGSCEFFDCAGVCGGESVVDSCGECDPDPENDCIQDCDGIWGGITLIDECGACDGNGPEYECWDGSLECDSTFCSSEPCNGSDIDNDNICDDIDNCIGNMYDECGACDGNGPQYECWDGSLECDSTFCSSEPCNGPDIDNDNICDDIDNCIGNMYDECGACDGNGPEYECWDGSLECDSTFCDYNVCEEFGDADGDGICNDVDDCNGNIYDQCGVCGGDGTSCEAGEGPYFTPAYLEYSDNPYLAMNLTITTATLDGIDLQDGDEIGIFDGEVCVGSGIVDGTIMPSNMLAIVASAQEASWPAGTGFTSGNSISYRFWDANENTEITSVQSEYLQGSGVFTNQGSTYVNLSGESSGGEDAEDDCQSGIYDCAGVCDGSSVVDECGICDSDGSSCGDAPFNPEVSLDLSSLNAYEPSNITYNLSQLTGESYLSHGTLSADSGYFNFGGLAEWDSVGYGTMNFMDSIESDTIFTNLTYLVEVAELFGDDSAYVFTRIIYSNNPDYPHGMPIGGYVLTNSPYSGVSVYAQSPGGHEITNTYSTSLTLGLFVNPGPGVFSFYSQLYSVSGDYHVESFDFEIDEPYECSRPVCLSIENVDEDAGTLDVYMKNQAGCFYWVYGDDCSVDLTCPYENFDSSISNEECDNIEGSWFDGGVGGFQFELFGIAIDNLQDGIAGQYLDFVEYDSTTGIILGFSMTGGTIPPGEEILTQVIFSNYGDSGICFGTDPVNNVISDINANYVAADWFDDCYEDDCPEGYDECGICGGIGPQEGYDCYGNCIGEIDECGVCGGPGAIYECGCTDIASDEGDIAVFTISPTEWDTSLISTLEFTFDGASYSDWGGDSARAVSSVSILTHTGQMYIMDRPDDWPLYGSEKWKLVSEGCQVYFSGNNEYGYIESNFSLPGCNGWDMSSDMFFYDHWINIWISSEYNNDENPPDCLLDCPEIENIDPEEDASGFCQWIMNELIDSDCAADCDGEIMDELNMMEFMCQGCLEAEEEANGSCEGWFGIGDMDGEYEDCKSLYTETACNTNNQCWWDEESIECEEYSCLDDCSGIEEMNLEDATAFCYDFIENIWGNECTEGCAGEEFIMLNMMAYICEECLATGGCDNLFDSGDGFGMGVDDFIGGVQMTLGHGVQFDIIYDTSDDLLDPPLMYDNYLYSCCGPVNVTIENQACDCDGNTFDCNEVCGGDAVYDNCGVCDNDPSNDNLNQDCAGVCFGNSITDEEGACCNSYSIDNCNQCWGNSWDWCDADSNGVNNLEQWGYGAYNINIADIPDDQGGRVYVNFHGSFYDSPDDSMSVMGSYILQRLDGEEWIIVQSFDTFGEEYYTVEATTLYNNVETEFRVIANIYGNIYYSYENGFGMSIDNIAPATPENFMYSMSGSDITLNWQYDIEDDFQYHAVTSMWNTEYTIDNSFLVTPDGNDEYWVNSVDSNGNYSENSESIMSIDLHAGANLISFNVMPEDNSVSNVLSSLGDNVTGVITEGGATTQIEPGIWVGSLTEIAGDKGYWVILDEEDILLIIGTPIERNIPYNLHAGANLISYPYRYETSTSETLPDDVESSISGIITEGGATTQIASGTWVGSLTALEGGKGYWMILDEYITLTFENGCDEQECISLSRELSQRLAAYPIGYEFSQSTEQAFYFIGHISGIKIGDWVLAYNNDIVVGAREWIGAYTDIPVMGDDGNIFTKGYMETGLKPQFKILRDGELIELEDNLPQWSNNTLHMVDNLRMLPESFNLSAAYPNPFNPTTTLSFALPIDSKVYLSIYNLQGREVASLVNSNLEAGYHSVVWDANSYASGVYFVKMVAGEFVNTQKLMLIK